MCTPFAPCLVRERHEKGQGRIRCTGGERSGQRLPSSFSSRLPPVRPAPAWGELRIIMITYAPSHFSNKFSPTNWGGREGGKAKIQ